MEGMYGYMRIKAADNGWVLCYDQKVKNPMMPDSTFGDNYTHEERKLVFEESKGVSNEQALENALEHMKHMLLANKSEKLENPGHLDHMKTKKA